uniref:Carboxypeptidase n=2 Tax=Spongospora subterranea TaxID=70186 RepID=A0A0H5QZK3_9EUKA|eukprot:CRZ00999.1 hypothetical protein [Spongospora subterranea]
MMSAFWVLCLAVAVSVSGGDTGIPVEDELILDIPAAEAYIASAPTFWGQARRRSQVFGHRSRSTSAGVPQFSKEWGQVKWIPGYGESKEKQYSGYISFGEPNDQKHLFYYLVGLDPAKPTVLWLQGGPGVSSLYGSFAEIGPYEVHDDMTVTERIESWHQDANLLFIDNPVGTGFSFSDKPTSLDHNEVTIANDLVDFLQIFYRRHSELRETDFFIFGESYGGKYVPSLARAILKHNRNVSPDLSLRLAGIAVGNGWTHPETQLMHYDDVAFMKGLIDERQAATASGLAHEVYKMVQAKNFTKASQSCDSLVGYIQKCGANFSPYNVREFTEEKPLPFYDWLNKPDVRHAFHVGNISWGFDSDAVMKALEDDIMRSALPAMKEVLESNEIKVLVYNGGDDFICNLIGTEEVYLSLQWTGQGQYLKADRRPWYNSNKEVAGFVRKAGVFTQLSVNSAGHMVPTDQPSNARQLLQTFLHGEF